MPSGGIGAYRPTASTGTITNGSNAYDLPSGNPDEPPYTTYADRAAVTGGSPDGTVVYDVVEYNTFPSLSKTNFSECQLVIGLTASLSATCITSLYAGGYVWNSTFVTSHLSIDYQIDGTNWVTIKYYTVKTIDDVDLGGAANSITVKTGNSYIPGDPATYLPGVETFSVSIPASSFPSNLNSLKVRFRLGTCTNSVTPAYKSSGSYNVWDIRANLS